MAERGREPRLGGDGTSAVWEQSDLLVVLNYVCLSVGVVITLRTLTRGARPDQQRRDPVLASLATSLIFAAAALERDGWASAFLRGASWLVLGVAFWTFLWTYASLQLELARLGREHLPDVVGVVVGLLVLGGALGFFFLSLLRLHRQMAEVKASELATARDLSAQAYEPVRRTPTLDTLGRQQSLLGAADALEKRAKAIHEWPIDEATLAWVITITTSVLAMSIGRMILDPLGL